MVHNILLNTSPHNPHFDLDAAAPETTLTFTFHLLHVIVLRNDHHPKYGLIIELHFQTHQAVRHFS